MSAANKTQDPHPKARNYGAFQSEIYSKGMFHGILPSVTTDPNKLEAQAAKVMSSRSYAYVAGGAGERATMDANRLAFRQWKVCVCVCVYICIHEGACPASPPLHYAISTAGGDVSPLLSHHRSTQVNPD